MRHRPRRNTGRSVSAVAAIVLAATVSCAPAARGPAGRDGRRLPVRETRVAGNRFEGDFGARLTAADPSRRFVALVDLTEQLDLPAFTRRLSAGPATKAARREAVIAALEAVAARQQSRLAPLLNRLVAEGAIIHVEPVAVVNRLVVTATAHGLLTLGASAEVAAVLPDWTSERAPAGSAEESTGPEVPLGGSFRSWAIDAMNVPPLWKEGVDGTGVVVAAIDTGAFESHEQLRGRRLPGARGWFDPVEGTTSGVDHHGHGTGVLVQAVGGNPEGRVVGMAPGARWAMALGNWKNFYARSRMTLAADWALRVARPDVLVNAWSHDEGRCNAFDRPFIDAWKASGIFVVFPAGNGGPAASSGDSPAELSGVFSVAALAPSGGPHESSSRGPSRCGSQAFPSLAAPGAGLPVATPDGPKAYHRADGTSLSAGLVGGAAALLLQAEPETDPDTLERVLVESTRDVAPAGFDDATGAGAIDVAAALARLRRGQVAH